MKIKFVLFAVLFVAISNFLVAQGSGNYGLPKKKDFDKLSIGFSGGINWFQGDIQSGSENNSGIFDNLKNPVLGLKLGYQMTHSVQANIRGYWTKFSGTRKAKLSEPLMQQQEIRIHIQIQVFQHLIFRLR